MTLSESIVAIYQNLDIADTRGLAVDVQTMVDLYNIASSMPTTNRDELVTARSNIIGAIQQYEMSSEANIEPILDQAKISLSEYESVNS